MRKITAVILTIVIATTFVSLTGCAIRNQPANSSNTVTVSDSKWVGLAKALTTAGAKMYGAFWCAHCQDQKKEFGEAFQYVTYIECAPDKNNPYVQSSSCKAAAIGGYPTWVFADGSRVEGTMSFTELANKIGYQATP